MGVRRRAALAGLLAAPFLPKSHAWAQSGYPDRPIRFVLGFPPGGSADLTARALSEEIKKQRGWTLVLEHKPGAGANIASEVVAKAAPDGYTILLGGNFSHAINPTLYRRLNFDTEKDFVPITRVTDGTQIICVNPALGVKTLRELIDKVKAEPGKHNYATAGAGTPQHLAGAMLNKAAGIDMVHVPFRGGAPALQAVLAGDVMVYIATPPVVLSHTRAGRLTALSVVSAERSPVMPEIPGARESGLEDYDFTGWFAVWGPAGMPDPIVRILFEAFVQAAQSPSVVSLWEREGQRPSLSASPAEFGEFVRRERVRWAEAVTVSGAVVE